MPDVRKTIIFDAETRNLESKIQVLKRVTSDLGRATLEESRQFGTTAKENIQYYNERIRQIEKAGQLERQAAEIRVSGELREAQKGQPLYEQRRLERGAKEEIAKIGEGSEEEKLQTGLLRQIVETIKGQAREEIREDRKGVEQTITAYRRGRLKDLSAEEEIKIRQQQEILQGEAKDQQRRPLGPGGVAAGMLTAQVLGQAVQAVVGAPNVFQALPQLANLGITTAGAATAAGVGALGAIPGVDTAGVANVIRGTSAIFAQMLSGVMSRAFQEATPYEAAMGVMAGIGGGGRGEYRGIGRGAEQYGFSLTEHLQQMAITARATGLGGEAADRTMQALILRRGAGLETGQITALERLGRGEVAGLGARGMTDSMIKGLQMAGVVGEQGNLSLLPEYMEILVQLSQKQLETMGEVDTGINTRMILGITKLDDAFRNPVVASKVMMSLHQGLVTASTPQIEALQYSALSRINPGGSLWELRKMREAGAAGPSGLAYLSSLLGRLKGASLGGREEFWWNIETAFPGMSATTAERVGRGFTTGRLSLEQIRGLIPEELDPEARAFASTTELQESTAKLANIFAETGSDLVAEMKSLTAEITKWLTAWQEDRLGEEVTGIIKKGTLGLLPEWLENKIKKDGKKDK